MTYAAAITDMKQQVSTAKTAVADALASLYSVSGATTAQANELNNFISALNAITPNLIRLEATPTPTT